MTSCMKSSSGDGAGLGLKRPSDPLTGFEMDRCDTDGQFKGSTVPVNLLGDGIAIGECPAAEEGAEQSYPGSENILSGRATEHACSS